MAVRAMPASWESSPTAIINKTDYPKLFYDPVMTLEKFNEWHKDVTIALCGDAGCNAVLRSSIMYGTLAKVYAQLKAARNPRLDDYQIGDTIFKPEDWAIKTVLLSQGATPACPQPHLPDTELLCGQAIQESSGGYTYNYDLLQCGL